MVEVTLVDTGALTKEKERNEFDYVQEVGTVVVNITVTNKSFYLEWTTTKGLNVPRSPR